MPLEEPFEVGYRGIVEPVTITVKHQTLTKADEGKPAKFTANMEVSLCADGDSPAGQIVVVDEKGRFSDLNSSEFSSTNIQDRIQLPVT